LIEYLPLNDSLIDILDFVELKDDYPTLKDKVRQFNKKFNIIEEENMIELKEELIKLKNSKLEFHRNNSISLLHLWDRLEKEEKLIFLPKIMKVAQSLPTSSATIEQSFSIIKLLKTSLRNKLSQSSLEGLIFVGQEFRDKKDFIISDKMVELYNSIKKSFNDQKSGKRKTNSLCDNQTQPQTEQMEIIYTKPLTEHEEQDENIGDMQEEEEMLEGLSEQLSLLNIPETEVIKEKPREGKKRRKPLGDLLKGFEELEGKDISFKKSKGMN